VECREWSWFFSNARGSLKELEPQVTIAKRLQYISKVREADLLRLIAEVGRLITGLAKAFRKRL
jgi:four helix bundle protein